MLAQDWQRHLLDPVLVIQQLALVFHQQRSRELPQGGRSTRSDQSADQQRLVHVAHPHPCTDELDDLLSRVHLPMVWRRGQDRRAINVQLATVPDGHSRSVAGTETS